MDADVLSIDSIPNRKFTGSVREIIPVADPAVKAFRVRVAVLARGGARQLPAGGFARAEIHVGHPRWRAGGAAKSAVKSETGERFVFTVENGKAEAGQRRTGPHRRYRRRSAEGSAARRTIVAVACPALVEGAAVAVGK